MQKISILLLATLFALQTNAQIKKGSILLGGQIGASSSKSNDVIQSLPTPLTSSKIQKSSLFGLNIGTAFKENKVIGLNFFTNSIKENSDFFSNNSSSIKSNQIEIGVFYRQYKKLAKDFYIFGQADIAATSGKGSGSSTNSSPTFVQDFKQSGGRLYLSTGVGYAVLKKLQVEISLPNLLGLQFLNSKFTESAPNARTQENKQFSFNSSLTNSNVLGNLSVGFRLVL